MALITGFAIDEAAELELADGGRFGDTLFGSQVIEAARELLQQSEQTDDSLPLGESTSGARTWGAAGCA